MTIQKQMIVYTGLLLLLAACRSSNKPGKDILPPDSMKLVVWDMLRADQLAVIKVQKDTNKIKPDYHYELFNDVLTIHHLTKDQFYKSYRYYLAHPDINKALVDSLSTYGDKKRMERFQTKQAPKAAL